MDIVSGRYSMKSKFVAVLMCMLLVFFTKGLFGQEVEEQLVQNTVEELDIDIDADVVTDDSSNSLNGDNGKEAKGDSESKKLMAAEKKNIALEKKEDAKKKRSDKGDSESKKLMAAEKKNIALEKKEDAKKKSIKNVDNKPETIGHYGDVEDPMKERIQDRNLEMIQN